MRLLLSLFFLAISTLTPSFAQKQLKDIRAALKAKKPADALKLIEQQRKDTLKLSDSRCFYLGVEAALLQNEQLNERIYLQQKPDTAALFQSLHTLFSYALLTDSAEVSELKDLRKAPSHRAALQKLLNRLYPNLSIGAQYFVGKNDWENVRRLATMTLEARKSPIFSSGVSANITQQQLIANAEQYLYACFAAGQFRDAEQYAELALKDTSKLTTILETLALVNAANKNVDGYRHYLRRGVTEFPLHLFFFKSLSEDLFAHKDYTAVVALAQSLEAKDSTNALFPLALAQAYDALKENQPALQAAQRALAADSTLHRAHLYIGRAFYREARAIQLPLSIRSDGYKQALDRQKTLYQQARPHLEKFRAIAPQDLQEWQPLLYEVYLKLNMGKEFEAISKLNPTHKS